MSDLVGEIDIILHENKQLREQNRERKGRMARAHRMKVPTTRPKSSPQSWTER